MAALVRAMASAVSRVCISVSPVCSALEGAGIHPEHFPVVPIEIVEAPHIHEAVILRIGRERAAGGERLVDERVDLIAAVDADREERVGLLPRIAERPLAEVLELLGSHEHEE